MHRLVSMIAVSVSLGPINTVADKHESLHDQVVFMFVAAGMHSLNGNLVTLLTAL